jgi:hypothetical protein
MSILTLDLAAALSSFVDFACSWALALAYSSQKGIHHW